MFANACRGDTCSSLNRYLSRRRRLVRCAALDKIPSDFLRIHIRRRDHATFASDRCFRWRDGFDFTFPGLDATQAQKVAAALTEPRLPPNETTVEGAGSIADYDEKV